MPLSLHVGWGSCTFVFIVMMALDSIPESFATCTWSWILEPAIQVFSVTPNQFARPQLTANLRLRLYFDSSVNGMDPLTDPAVDTTYMVDISRR